MESQAVNNHLSINPVAFKKWLAFIILGLSSFSQAEVYRWTDASGKVHYGDKKPAEQSENITDQVKQINVDTSGTEHKKLERIFRKENAADREYAARNSRPDPNLLARCREARQYLRDISGRVSFVDTQGKLMRVTETERQQMVKETKAAIAEHCPSQ